MSYVAASIFASATSDTLKVLVGGIPPYYPIARRERRCSLSFDWPQPD